MGVGAWVGVVGLSVGWGGGGGGGGGGGEGGGVVRGGQGLEIEFHFLNIPLFQSSPFSVHLSLAFLKSTL